MIVNKKILIIGGTGSLGYKLTERYKDENKIFLYSRDESKHWKMNIDFCNHPNINFLIGDIRNNEKISETLLRINPNIIILAAAMKHIDKCEYEMNESILTNLIGTQNVLNNIEKLQTNLNNLESVLFISTDKACSPVNVYGMCKSLSELLIIEKSKYITDKKFICVRYGNVLNSRGSIIPILKKLGENNSVDHFKLTDERMTRFVMSIEESVNLIEHALIHGESGDIVIPKLSSCRIKDIIELYSIKYNKPIVLDKLRPGEKLSESLINDTQSLRTVNNEKYLYIKPVYNNKIFNIDSYDYNSNNDILSIEELKQKLIDLELY
jgi:UDP-N-acetylglucosamine 4,6-dehydratase